MPNGADVAWLAGLLEGEGTFGWYCVQRLGCRPYWRSVITLQTNDADVAERAAGILQTNPQGPYWYKRNKYPPCYRVQQTDQRKARIWMQRLHPYMSARRRAAIEWALMEHEFAPRGPYVP